VRELLIKICGMTDPENIAEIVKLKPQYLGFILYEGSPRSVNLLTVAGLIKYIPNTIQKTAVLVNEPIEKAVNIAQSGVFDLIQLHGNESADYCKMLAGYIRIIKAFSVHDSLPEDLPDYQRSCSMFLFDTAGEKPGGTGKKFNHSILKNYSLKPDYIISGGISAGDSEYIKSIRSGKMAGVDLNSRFEIKPGIKDIKLLKSFIEKIRSHDKNDR
jgi:phosphoribosylanthranilate isomerase